MASLPFSYGVQELCQNLVGVVYRAIRIYADACIIYIHLHTFIGVFKVRNVTAYLKNVANLVELFHVHFIHNLFPTLFITYKVLQFFTNFSKIDFATSPVK